MPEMMRKSFDVLVIGAGPAGMAAAASAARAGVRVGVVDDNPTVGGQIWRGETAKPSSHASRRFARLHAVGVVTILGASVIHENINSRVLLAETRIANYEIGFSKLIIATGARERVLPFPGWTLPNIMTAGGLQALVKSGLLIAKKRVIVAGTGPLLLAVTAYLQSRGAKIVALCEQASWATLASFAVGLLVQPGKIWQALLLRRQIESVPLWTNSWPIRAQGNERLERLTVLRNGQSRELACDYLACGFHLVPNTELAVVLGCALKGGYVEVDEQQQTSVPAVYCAGEPTGIGGLESSLIEGEIAGMAATGMTKGMNALLRRCNRAQRFARSLDRAFTLRPELKRLPDGDTIVCRCEDVPHSRAASFSSWRDAKNQVRCGMGPCQGRICGPATEFLYGWRPDSIRSPIFPARIETLAAMASVSADHEEQYTGGVR